MQGKASVYELKLSQDHSFRSIFTPTFSLVPCGIAFPFLSLGALG